MVARYGGEEFAVILPGTTRIAAAKLAEAIRRRVAAMDLAGPEGQTLHVTTSIGVATHDGSFFTHAAQFIKAADQGVYAAKRAGRNCVRIFAPRESANVG
jgi:two-component system, cell cycle response regulator